MNLDHLSKLNSTEFELERAKIISNHIKSIPDAKTRKRMLAFQLELDLIRMDNPDDFLRYCVHEMSENFANMQDLILSRRVRYET